MLLWMKFEKFKMKISWSYIFQEWILIFQLPQRKKSFFLIEKLYVCNGKVVMFMSLPTAKVESCFFFDREVIW